MQKFCFGKNQFARTPKNPNSFFWFLNVLFFPPEEGYLEKLFVVFFLLVKGVFFSLFV